MPELVVGCPVAAREWILPTWFEYVQEAWEVAGVKPYFLFVLSEHDMGVINCLRDQTQRFDVTIETLRTDEPLRLDLRRWNMERYQHMVELRNLLLARVRELAPEYFWSLDSDMLPHRDALKLAIEAMPGYDAIGMHTYMTPAPYSSTPLPWHAGREWASRGDLNGKGVIVNRKVEEHERGTRPTGVIMGSKLMSPAAYGIDYRVQQEGEDAGWSEACAEAGLKLGWSFEALCKHVHNKQDLYREDCRVGF